MALPKAKAQARITKQYSSLSLLNKGRAEGSVGSPHVKAQGARRGGGAEAHPRDPQGLQDTAVALLMGA